MKTLIVLLLLLSFSFSEAAEKKAKVVWLVAPGIWDQAGENKTNHLQMLELFLEKSVGAPVKIEIKTVPGFMLNQLSYLVSEVQSNPPDWIFYIQRASFYAFDLRDLWLSNTPVNHVPVATALTTAEIEELIPWWFKPFSDWQMFSELKRAIVLKRRISAAFKDEPYFTTIDQYLIYSSQYISEHLSRMLAGKTKLVFLISPERTKYSEWIFPDSNLASLFARAYFYDTVIERAELKNETAKRSFEYVLMPKEFGELTQNENLIKDSSYVLNSSGVLRSFQILMPVLINHLKTNSRR